MNQVTSGMAVELVDAHCHVDLFGKDEAAVIGAIERLKVHTIAVTNAPSVFFHTREAARDKKFLYPSIGLHPELVASHEHELDKMWSHFSETRFVGEVGLDYVTNDENCRCRQRNVFTKILSKSAESGNKVITVHSRRSAVDVLSAIGAAFPGTVILHWFSGTNSQLDRAIEIGCWFSVNPAMLRSKSGRDLLARMPQDRILTETDGPFVSVDGVPARPECVEIVVRALAVQWNDSFENAACRVFENFQRALAT